MFERKTGCPLHNVTLATKIKAKYEGETLERYETKFLKYFKSLKGGWKIFKSCGLTEGGDNQSTACTLWIVAFDTSLMNKARAAVGECMKIIKRFKSQSQLVELFKFSPLYFYPTGKMLLLCELCCVVCRSSRLSSPKNRWRKKCLSCENA